MDLINDITKKLSSKLDVAGAVCFFMVMVLILASIIMRRVIGQPIMGAYEKVGLLTMAGIALGQANCAMKDGHIALTLIVDRLSPLKQLIIDIVVYIISLAFWIIITWRLFIFGITTMRSGMVSSTAMVPIYPFIFILTFSVLCLCLVLAAKLARYVGIAIAGRGGK